MDMQKLLAIFDRYALHQDNFTAFEQLLDAFLVPFRLYDTKEEVEKALLLCNSHERNPGITALLEEIGILSEGFNDPVGELFMLRVSRGKSGQFFTPASECDLLATITLGMLEPRQTVFDPACGSGRMLLAAAKRNHAIRCYGADIDATCVKMAVMNMLLQSLSGEIAHMDSLSNSFYGCYRIGTILRDGYHFPCYRWFTDPEESVLFHRNKNTGAPPPSPFKAVPVPSGRGEQGSLF